jgi:hypothetical protein
VSASAWSTEARKTASNSCRLDAPTLRRRLNQLRASKTIRNIKVRVGFSYRCPEIFRQSTKVPEQASNFEALDRSDHGSCANSQQLGDPFEAGVTLTGLTIEMFDQCGCNPPIVFVPRKDALKPRLRLSQSCISASSDP